MRLSTLIVSLVFAFLLLGSATEDLAAQGHTEVIFLDVGQGDATLIRSGGRVALIDAGPSDDIVDELKRRGVQRIDLLIASHNHADHIGGMDALLDELPVTYYLDNGEPASTRIQERVLERLARKDVRVLSASARTVQIGSAKLHIRPSPLVGKDDEQNNLSLLTLIEEGRFRALLTGDSEYEEIASLVSAGLVPDVDVLKAAHHGSRNGVTPALISRAKPEVVVISLGAGNSYGHPHSSALRYYQAGGRRVLRTDLHGSVSVRVAPDGSYQIGTEKNGRSGQ